MLGDAFGALGELPFATIREADSLASADVVVQVIALEGTEAVEYLVELYPFQRTE